MYAKMVLLGRMKQSKAESQLAATLAVRQLLDDLVADHSVTVEVERIVRRMR